MKDRRAQARMLCSELVDVRWKDRHGRSRESLANLEDISVSGVCLQMDEPVPPDTTVLICHSRGEFQGAIRYCLYRDVGYFLGVQFAPGCEWSPQTYQPQHLLDLRMLVVRSARRETEKHRDNQSVQ